MRERKKELKNKIQGSEREREREERWKKKIKNGKIKGVGGRKKGKTTLPYSADQSPYVKRHFL